MSRYKNREDAGRKLGEALADKGYANAVVLGIPRGGVPVAAVVAQAIRGQLGVVVARKLRAPAQPELAIGAVTADGATWINTPVARDTGADQRYLDREIATQVAEAKHREEAFDGHRQPRVEGRVVIIVDDGIATGATAIAAARSMRNSGAKEVVLAVPVAPPDTVAALQGEFDAIVCPRIERDFWAIGQFYDDFRQVGDDQVKATLERFAARPETIEGRVRRGPVELAARLRVPAPDAPLVTFVHGLGSSKDSPRNVVIAERLFDRGLATLLFDLSGHGDSGPGREGDIDAYILDLAAALNWADAQGVANTNRQAVAGSSLGAVVALRAAAEGAIQPAALVLRAPPARPEDYAGLRTPALVLVGSEDHLLGAAREAARMCPFVELRVVPGAGHLFEEPGTLEEATEITTDWLVGKLLPSAAAAR